MTVDAHIRLLFNIKDFNGGCIMRNINPEGKPVARCILITDDLILLRRRVGDKGQGIALRYFLRIVGAKLNKYIVDFVKVYPLALVGMAGGFLISPVLHIDLYRFHAHFDQSGDCTTH